MQLQSILKFILVYLLHGKCVCVYVCVFYI